MTYIIPVLGALALAVGTILQRFILRKKKIDIKLYQTMEFFAIVLAMLPLIYFFWKLDAEALQLKNILIFSLVVIFSIIANLFTFYSMKWERIGNLEPAKILEPLFVILLAILFSFVFGEVLYERNLFVIIPALIAGCALIFSHIEKRHLKFNKYFIAAIIGSFFFALELIISRLILNFYSPITFYFLRCSSILLISLLAFRPNLKNVNKKLHKFTFLIGIVWVIYRVVVYYGYLTYGVVFTTLIIMLGPLFIYIFAKIFLKEKLKAKNIIAAAVIVACIAYTMLS